MLNIILLVIIGILFILVGLQTYRKNKELALLDKTREVFGKIIQEQEQEIGDLTKVAKQSEKMNNYRYKRINNLEKELSKYRPSVKAGRPLKKKPTTKKK